MTIRFQCSECDSVLKIKDELAGTDGKCPKCKTKFVVPAVDEPVSEGKTEKSSPKETRSGKKKPSNEKAASKKKSKSPAKKSGGEDDFDPAAFLMEDGPGPKASAGLRESQGGSGKSTPARSSSGGGGSKARAASMSSASASPAAEPSDPQGNTTASANARDLLSKSADESRVRAASMPVEEKKPLLNFDFSGFSQELKRFAPHIIGTVAGVGLLFWFMNKGPNLDLPNLGNVSGTVTVDGKPLVGIAVKFSPNEDVRENPDEGPKKIRPATGVTDENGYYTMYYLDGVKGAPVGKGKLWMEVRSAQDLSKIPGEWASPGAHNREVRETGNNREGEFDIVIKTKQKSQ